MPTSAPGSDHRERSGRGKRSERARVLTTSLSGARVHGHRHGRTPAAHRGFTLIELLVVLVLVAIGAATVGIALRDSAATKLEEEAARLTALLEGARAEARAAGVAVVWVPAGDDERANGFAAEATAVAADEGFRFVGLPVSVNMPRNWLEPRVTAHIVGGRSLVLGPDAILPAQRVVLSLDNRRIEIATDGLAPFAIAPAAEPGSTP